MKTTPDQPESRVLSRFRRFTHHAWLLHAWVMAGLVLLPVSQSFAGWVTVNDSNNLPWYQFDDLNEDAVEDAGETVQYFNSDTDALNDHDERALGTDPQNPDSDYDGLIDSNEVAYSTSSCPLNPLSWDSNGNGYSDHDEYFANGVSLQVNYVSNPPSISGWTYANWDADGAANLSDSDPFNPALSSDWNHNGTDDANDPDPDTDDDGVLNESDSHPGNASLWSDWSGNGVNDDQQTDGDGVPDDQDSHPSNSSLWSDWSGNGVNDDQQSDGDGVPDDQDSHPLNTSLWSDWNGDGANDDQDGDGDGVPDVSDSHPANISLWSDWSGNGVNDDQQTDADGVPDDQDSHPSNASLWCDWNGNGTNDTAEVDSDADTVWDSLDSHPANIALWSDWNGNGVNDTQNSDADSVADDYDSHPLNGALWSDWNGTGINDDQNSDTDSVVDDYDSHPSNGALWSDWNNNGINDDQHSDSDGVADENDSDPLDSLLWADWNRNGVNDFAEPPPPPDSDGDGTADDLDSDPSIPALWSDWDHDGLNAADEPSYNANPDVADTDGDGLLDGEEVQYNTFANVGDSDGDYLTDFEELRVYQTDNLNPRDAHTLSKRHLDNEEFLDSELVDAADTDLDGIPNIVEDFYAPYMNKTLATDAGGDLDGDTVTNLAEYQAGTDLRGDFSVFDFDHDRITDATEFYWAQQHPGICTFSPIVFEDAVADFDGDGVMNFEELEAGLDPGDANTIESNTELTIAGEGVDATDYEAWLVFSGQTLTARVPAPAASVDKDADGMQDVWEYRFEFNLRLATNAPLDPDYDGVSNRNECLINTNPLIKDSNTQTAGNDGDGDFDHDGLTNSWENFYGTSLISSDTDGDGFSDQIEIWEGSDPLDGQSNSGRLIGLTFYTQLE